ncbi:MAG: tetratricopeptide repeat protein [Bacteroidota bacterium]
MPNLEYAAEHLAAGRLGDALRTLREHVEQFPMHPTAFALLGQALEQAGHDDAALKAWRQARLLLPNAPQVNAAIERLTGYPLTIVPERPALHNGDDEWFEVGITAADLEAETVEAGPLEEEPLWTDLGQRVELIEQNMPEPEAAAQFSVDVTDLDDLIRELDGARIVPDPDLDAFSPPIDEAGDDDMVSETLARIYFAQKQYTEAARIYRQLATQHPSQAERYLAKAADAERMAG